MLIDIILLIILAIAVYKGWTKGFIMAVFVFVSYFIALALAFHFSGTVEGYMRENAASDSQWYSFLSFVLVMIAGIIAVRLIGKLIEKSAELLMLGFFNRVMGILVMALIYSTFFAVILVYCKRFNIISDGNSSDSRTFAYLFNYGQWMVSHFSEWLPALKNLFNDATRIVDKSSTIKSVMPSISTCQVGYIRHFTFLCLSLRIFYHLKSCFGHTYEFTIRN